MSGLVIGLPSKGRLKEQTEAWLADGGLSVSAGGGRGYVGAISALPGVQVQFLSAGAIAAALEAGDIHLGVTGEDLLRERGAPVQTRFLLLRALGFGRADVVVAAPQSWLDVDAMADVDEVAQAFLARTGGRLRVATKYGMLTRAFFAAHGIADYRIVHSDGATEGAPAAGAAELVVDITTTGATLAANHLKVLSDGVILKSEAQLVASLSAPWNAEQVETVRSLLAVVEARGRARKLATVIWPSELDAAAQAASAAFVTAGASRRSNGLLIDQGQLFALADSLTRAGVGPVSVTRPDYVFEAECAAADRLAAAVRL